MYIKIMDYIYSQKQVQKNIGQSDTLLSVCEISRYVH